MDETPHHELLGHQLVMNGQTWAALQRHGVSEATELRLDFTYHAPSEASARSLHAFLVAETDYDIEVPPGDSGSAGRWSVAGKTQPTTVSHHILDQWVGWMIAAGLQHHCEFDGWGTSIPPRVV
jgi:hypothetical protein